MLVASSSVHHLSRSHWAELELGGLIAPPAHTHTHTHTHVGVRPQDDAWMSPMRDRFGKLQADPTRFPSGMQWLADQMHQRGLLLGLYGCPGVRTCLGFPGQFEHEYQDAETIASCETDPPQSLTLTRVRRRRSSLTVPSTPYCTSRRPI
jgi:hypothetical protein